MITGEITRIMIENELRNEVPKRYITDELINLIYNKIDDSEMTLNELASFIANMCVGHCVVCGEYNFLDDLTDGVCENCLNEIERYLMKGFDE